MFSDANLQAFITAHKIPAKLIKMTEPTPTVPDAANALGVTVEQILKSLVFLIDSVPHLIIAAGEARIDTKLLAAECSVSRRKIRFASAEQALDLSGFIVGSMPPFGHKQVFPTLLDTHSLHHFLINDRHAVLYGGGGTKSHLLEISLEQLIEVTGAKLAPLTERTTT